MRKTAICLLLTLCLSLTAFVLPVRAAASAEPSFSISCKSVYMLNLETGTVVYEKDAGASAYPAALAQIMTTILALESGRSIEERNITVPSDIYEPLQGKNYSTAGFVAGEVLSLNDLCYSMILQSAAEAALVVARELGGDVDTFVSMMNQKAREIGATATNFTNPTGLYDPNQVTTARDLAVITQYALKLEGFRELAGSYSYVLEATNKRSKQALVSTVRLMEPNGTYYYGNASGIKTGSMNESGRSLITVVEKDDYSYLLVLLGADIFNSDGERIAEMYNFIDAISLSKWAFETFQTRKLSEVGQSVAQCRLELVWDRDYILLAVDRDFYALLPSDLDLSSIQAEVSLPDIIRAPIDKGVAVGAMTFYLDGEKIGEVGLVTMEGAQRNFLLYMKSWIGSVLGSSMFIIIWLVLLLLIGAYIVLVVIHNRRRRLRKKR